ncbi:hypothetical protein JNB71_23710 [Rhizobium herbae]|uniref:Uncharacterized protein n=1 Tax=Rhizobium herbae TaxID=508661 RepID=A0ABS7HIP9_9HYPH|nr:hypothetical protein [Rhizobium herbae]MBW9066314.1 hypothetical protein [Rhizobium herbae]
MPSELLAALFLSLAMGFSFSRFRQIFLATTDHAILLSPATALASSISLSSAAMACSGNGIGIGATIAALGVALAVVIGQSALGTSARLALAAACLFAHAGLGASP